MAHNGVMSDGPILKRYMVFGGKRYGEKGGMSDFLSHSNDLPDIVGNWWNSFANEYKDHWIEILDTHTGKLIMSNRDTIIES